MPTTFKHRTIDYTYPVQVYRCLSRDTYSIRQRGLVVAHAPSLQLVDASFHIQEGGRQRCLQEKRKNVHAYVQGTLVNNKGDSDRMIMCVDDVERVSYNPYKSGEFKRVCKDAEYEDVALHHADLVHFTEGGVFVPAPNYAYELE